MEDDDDDDDDEYLYDDDGDDSGNGESWLVESQLSLCVIGGGRRVVIGSSRLSIKSVVIIDFWLTSAELSNHDSPPPPFCFPMAPPPQSCSQLGSISMWERIVGIKTVFAFKRRFGYVSWEGALRCLWKKRLIKNCSGSSLKCAFLYEDPWYIYVQDTLKSEGLVDQSEKSVDWS